MSERVNTATFLLGVGCQKGGTTWLHDYLHRSHQTDLGFSKEYHVFDALDFESSKNRYDKTLRKGRNKAPGDDRYEQARLMESFLTKPETYFDYFASRFEQSPEIKLTADITPAYSALTADRYGFIRDGFAQRGVRTKVIFLMRDPVERIWSSIRMRMRERAARNPNATMLRKGDEALLLKSYLLPNHAARTNYHLTIANLELVFDRSDIHYGFYERLFTEESTRTICAFLGIDHIDPEFDKKINASPKAASVSEETLRTVANAYRDVYAFAEGRFGAAFIREIWPSAALVGG